MLNFKKTLTVLAIGIFSNSVFSQIPAEKSEPKIDFGIEGMIGVAFNKDITGINVGGPSLKVKLKNLKIGAGAFPSLLIMDKKAAPRLAVSPILEYKKWMIIAPYYGYNSKDKMIWTFGLGYKFK